MLAPFPHFHGGVSKVEHAEFLSKIKCHVAQFRPLIAYWRKLKNIWSKLAKLSETKKNKAYIKTDWPYKGNAVKKIRALQYFCLECQKFRIWSKQTFLVWVKNPSKTATTKNQRLYKKQWMPSYCTLFWFKTEILAYQFFGQSENSLCKLKAYKWTYYAKNLLFWSTSFCHFFPFVEVLREREKECLHVWYLSWRHQNFRGYHLTHARYKN